MFSLPKVFLATAVLVLLGACSGGGGGDSAPGGNGEIRFVGAGNNGVFDAAITQDAGGRLWMSYSAVNFASGTTAYWTVRTRLAWSDDAGAGWTDAGLINDSVAAAAPPPYEAWWQQEVSHVVFDAGDSDATRRWKMLWHRYTYVHDTGSGAHEPAHENGWISLKIAASASALASAAERKLFTGYLYNSANDAYIGPPEFPLASLHAGLSDCAVFTEPGMLADSDGIYVVLRCAPLPMTSDVGKIVLLKCTHTPTRAFDSCSYLGNFLTDTEAPDHGAYDGFSAPELARAGSGIYLIVTPTNNDGYRGCLVFEVASLAGATLVRDGSSRAVTVRSINTGSSADHFGACGYHAGATSAGVIHGEYRTSATPGFRLYASRVNLP